MVAVSLKKKNIKDTNKVVYVDAEMNIVGEWNNNFGIKQCYLGSETVSYDTGEFLEYRIGNLRINYLEDNHLGVFYIISLKPEVKTFRAVYKVTEDGELEEIEGLKFRVDDLIYIKNYKIKTSKY